MKLMKHFPKQTALTLTELLVVITLIAALAMLSIPTVGLMRREGLRVKCMNNLREYGTALFAYLGDHQRFEDERPNFGALLVPNYLKTTLRCPLMRDTTEPGLNYTGNHGLNTYFRNPKIIPVPHSRVVFATENYGRSDGVWSPTHFNMTVYGVGDAAAGSQESREKSAGSARREQHHGTPHDRRLNLLFLDGHMESLAPKGNDWWLNAAEGGLYYRTPGNGIFYGTDQFRLISLGLMKL